jgi:L-iditol 2-dehydrogenase
VVVLVGGCPSGTEVTFDPGPLHYEELELRGTFHHDRDDVDRALVALADGIVPWEMLLGETISLEDLPGALSAPNGGPAVKWLVDPRR